MAKPVIVWSPKMQRPKPRKLPKRPKPKKAAKAARLPSD